MHSINRLVPNKFFLSKDNISFHIFFDQILKSLIWKVNPIVVLSKESRDIAKRYGPVVFGIVVI
ncbi:hypothetical protein BpHYR1_049248 [Brachionus plicatilis]|uniref:Uncharacterized protein n=1 Tax=Brachionus plicatilis TaxID=10195 RepID=A0A3M7QMX6_BRAPC|nr:hypothetical protein BpHYR1_049248 [Brachionus plicatilis]